MPDPPFAHLPKDAIVARSKLAAGYAPRVIRAPVVGAVSKRFELRRPLERMLCDRAAATKVVELVLGMFPVGVLRLRLSLHHRRVVDEAPVRAGTHARICQAHASQNVLGTAIEHYPMVLARAAQQPRRARKTAAGSADVLDS